MGFKQSPFPMHTGTKSHESALKEKASPAKGYKAEAAAHAGTMQDKGKKATLSKTDASGKYYWNCDTGKPAELCSLWDQFWDNC